MRSTSLSPLLQKQTPSPSPMEARTRLEVCSLLSLSSSHERPLRRHWNSSYALSDVSELLGTQLPEKALSPTMSPTHASPTRSLIARLFRSQHFQLYLRKRMVIRCAFAPVAAFQVAHMFNPNGYGIVLTKANFCDQIYTHLEPRFHRILAHG